MKIRMLGYVYYSMVFLWKENEQLSMKCYLIPRSPKQEGEGEGEGKDIGGISNSCSPQMLSYYKVCAGFAVGDWLTGLPNKRCNYKTTITKMHHISFTTLVSFNLIEDKCS